MLEPCVSKGTRTVPRRGEMSNHLFLFDEFYEKETYDEAQECIFELKNKSRDYPEPLRKYLDIEFFPNYSHYILYKQEDFKGKIPKTNNISEQKIHFCATQSEKKKYRTPSGFFNHVLSRIKFSKEF